MKNRFLLLLLLITVCSSVFGQERDRVSVRDTLFRSFSNRFLDNWDIGAAAGANVYFGEEDSKGNFLKRISPSFEIYATKMITPVVSLRGLASIGVVQGWYKSATPINPYDGNLHYEKFNMATVQLHALFDISNAIWGYNEKRKYSIVPFIGTGAAHPWGAGRNNRELIFLAGVLNKVYLSSKLDLTIELRHMLVNPRMNYIMKPGRIYEGMGTLLVGLSYKFGKRGIKKTSLSFVGQRAVGETAKDIFMGDNGQVNEVNVTIKNKDKLAGVPINTKDTVIIRDTVYVTPPLVLFFPINQSFLTDNELVKLDLYMQYVLQQNVSKEFKIFNITGHADKDTGNSEINQRLSELRVNTVCRILEEKYKISLDRISLKAEGDKNNPFENSSPNRAVIIQ